MCEIRQGNLVKDWNLSVGVSHWIDPSGHFRGDPSLLCNCPISGCVGSVGPPISNDIILSVGVSDQMGPFLRLSHQWVCHIRWAPISNDIIRSVGVSDQMGPFLRLSHQWVCQIRWAPVSNEIVLLVGVQDQMGPFLRLSYQWVCPISGCVRTGGPVSEIVLSVGMSDHMGSRFELNCPISG